MDLYSKFKEDEYDKKKRRSFIGGTPSDLFPFSDVMTKARQVAKKYVFNKKDKKNILDTGKQVIDDVLSENNTRKAISTGARKLRRKLGKYKKMRLKKRLFAKGGGGRGGTLRRTRRRRSMKGGSGRFRLNPYYKKALRREGMRIIRQRRRNGRPTRLSGANAAQRKVSFYRLGVKALEQKSRIRRRKRRRTTTTRKRKAPKRGATRRRRRKGKRAVATKRRRRKTSMKAFNLQNFVKRKSARQTKKGGGFPSRSRSRSAIKNTVFDL